MTETMLDAQYRDQVERWWSPQALSEIHRLLCTVAPLYRETGEHSAIEMSPKEQVSWMCQEIDRLRAEVQRLESALEEQHAGTDAVWNEKAELLKVIERLTAENERIETEAHGIDESLSLLSQQYKTLEAECERLKVERDGYSWAAKDLADALRHTQEYVGPETLPAIPGWSWFDALMRYEQIDGARKAGEEPLPTIDWMAGSDPDFTGEETTAEYLREIGRASEEPR